MKKRDDVYLSQIAERIRRIKRHLKGVSRSKFLKSQLHRSAVVRELEVIGEAARLVSDETKKKFPAVPWAQMVGMRNRLIHEYFDVDYGIVWDVASGEIAKLEGGIQKVLLDVAPPAHRWRNCPLGYYYVHPYPRQVLSSPKNPDGVTSVREHCRRNPSGKDQLYPREMKWLTESLVRNANEISGRVGKLKEPATANDCDQVILIWTQYWNEVFSAVDPLDPDVIKALLGSESSFRPVVKTEPRVAGRNFARGPLQITDQTRKALGDEKGELKEHFLTLTKEEVRQHEYAIPAAIRWLFHKKQAAAKYLGRDASWDEAVADYKSYLRRKSGFKSQKGMKNYFDWLSKLKAVPK
jgi:uncharacterized protein with HEPN domain